MNKNLFFYDILFTKEILKRKEKLFLLLHLLLQKS